MRTEDIRRHRKQAREFHRATGGLLGDSVCCGGVSVPQCHVLLELEESSGSTSLVALSEALGLDKSTVSRTVESLVSRKLVDRTPDAEDRRYVVLDLTDEGRTTVAAVNATADENVRRIFSHVPEERREEVTECFGLLVAAVRAADAETTCADGEDDADTEKSAQLSCDTSGRWSNEIGICGTRNPAPVRHAHGHRIGHHHGGCLPAERVLRAARGPE